MTLAQEIENDWQHIDGVITVSFTANQSGATAIPGIKALKRSISRKQESWGTMVGASPHDTVFHLWVATMGNSPPDIQPSDKITVDNVDWIILGARLTTLETRWECICRKAM